MKTILGTGQLGIAVMEALLKTNPYEEVTLVNGKGKLDRRIPDSVNLVAADVTDKNDMESILQKSDVTFSCADIPSQQRDQFYTATASALAYALGKTHTKLVYADNLCSHGNVAGNVVYEDLPLTFPIQKGNVSATVMNMLLDSEGGQKERVAIVSAADFIGPGICKGIFGTDFLDKLYKGKTIVLPGKLTVPHTFTYVNDFVTALINVGKATDTFGQIWHTPNALAMSLDKWIHLFEINTNKKAKVLALPKVLIGIAGPFNSLTREFRELAYRYESPFLVDHAKYISRFGNHATYPSSIVKETVQWYNAITKS